MARSGELVLLSWRGYGAGNGSGQEGGASKRERATRLDAGEGKKPLAKRPNRRQTLPSLQKKTKGGTVQLDTVQAVAQADEISKIKKNIVKTTNKRQRHIANRLQKLASSGNQNGEQAT